MTEQQGEPNNITAAVHPGYPNQMLGSTGSCSPSLPASSRSWRSTRWWAMGLILLGLVGGAGFPIFVASLLYPRHCGEL